MSIFSESSRKHLITCDIRLQNIFNEVVKTWDCTIICGHRGEEEQNWAYDNRRSSLPYPKSLHNTIPSKAVDVAPYPINWNDIIGFSYFAGYVMRVAYDQGTLITWGGDWNRNRFNKDQSFNDLPHFQLLE